MSVHICCPEMSVIDIGATMTEHLLMITYYAHGMHMECRHDFDITIEIHRYPLASPVLGLCRTVLIGLIILRVDFP